MRATPRDSARSRDELTRRDLLKIGGLSVLGATMPGLLRADSPRSTPPARSCIVIWLQGGLSHIDSFDPKPDAPREIRGEFGSIPTRVPGTYLSEHLPRLAACADKFSIIRGLDPQVGTHGLSEAYALSGRPYDPSISHPTYVSVLSYLDHVKSQDEYWNVAWQAGQAIDTRFGGGTSGFLRDWFAPHAAGLPDPRPSPTCDRYGLTRLGVACELASLSSCDAPSFGMLTDGGWDTHRGGFLSLRKTLLPRLDLALSSLLTDLSDRGTLDSTLVVVLSDFGRNPRVNALGGRDHCATAGVALMAGAGLRGGVVVGGTDEVGGASRDTPYTFEDIACTLYDRLGIDPNTTAPGPDGRPVRLIPDGRLIRELL